MSEVKKSFSLYLGQTPSRNARRIDILKTRTRHHRVRQLRASGRSGRSTSMRAHLLASGWLSNI